MNRTDWKKLYRQIRASEEPEAVNANGRKYYVGKMGVKPVTGRAVLFSLFGSCRMLEGRSSRLGLLRCARKYRLELQEAVRIEISIFGQAGQTGFAFR